MLALGSPLSSAAASGIAAHLTQLTLKLAQLKGGAPYESRSSQLLGLFEDRLARNGKLGSYTLEEVARHDSKDDAWVAVDGKVYDITPHVQAHAGWTSGCATSQLLAILRTLGTDCTDEVLEIHSNRALAQFAPFLIGRLVPSTDEQRQQQQQQQQRAAPKEQQTRACPFAAGSYAATCPFATRKPLPP